MGRLRMLMVFVQQLAYLTSGPNPLVDAVFGSSEILLFNVDKLITRIDSEPAQFFWITKQTCQEELGKLTNDQFLDFCLLLGSSFLPTFPAFETQPFPAKGPTIRDALPMFNLAGRSALALCAQFEEDRRVQDVQYTDLYKRAYMTVKHHVFIDVDGKVAPMDPDNTSNDMHEIIGQRLPEELYFYLSKGILGADIPNTLTSSEVLVSLPLGAEDTPIYRQVVGDTLTPIRAQAISLVANTLHRFYQTKVINVRTWFDENSDRSINLKNLSVKDTIKSWKINNEQLPEKLKKLPVRILTFSLLYTTDNTQETAGPFRFAVQSLKDRDFVPKSFAGKDSPVCISLLTAMI